jgi:hypothetical protein
MKTILILVLCSFLALPGIAQTRTAMTNSEFNHLLQSARNKGLKSLTRENIGVSFSDMFASSSTYFSTAQLRRLLSEVDRDSGRLALARLLYSRATDPDHFGSLSDLFRDSTYKDEFNIWVNLPDKESYDPDKKPYNDNSIVMT